MTDADLAIAPAVSGRQADALAAITAPGVHLALWERARPAALDGLDRFDLDTLADLAFTSACADLDADIAQGLDEAGYPQGATTRALATEVAELGRRFAAILACPAVRIRLEVIRTDACRKFHADYVTARLITTLVGPGTQWITADRPETVHEMTCGAVGLFKGRAWVDRNGAPREDAEPPILHRSVPLSQRGGARLLLVLDPQPGARSGA
ncbi:DUF1826 domain-containing protein [Novosphingobium sp. 1949]|uniref:DUF1826 domain-containing protein n=1 Tax=Novosphingobium organovorum TaxID=2930092 RepID=A0ABT0BEV7_9SPHN|nr:DUF1826 domain-containing protein [Novosphingobium organovorum]MCJ2183592.1 DUF1826 domain-containing protein [Novosphingobium organovorum]